MEQLNQFAVSKILGSTIKPVGSVGFGNFNLLSTTEEIQGHLRVEADDLCDASFSYAEDAEVVRAFEAIRKGAPTDELLWNKTLAKQFAEKCRKLGLPKVPQAYLIRRLINVRKSAPRYKLHGIEISATTKAEVHPSIVPQFAHVIEFSLVKLRFRYGASIDDILIDPALGEKFEDMATQIVPGISSMDLRLGALYIRKNRGNKKAEIEGIKKLNLSDLDAAWVGKSSLADMNLANVPVSPGIIELKEAHRYLYISHNENIHEAMGQLREGKGFQLIASNFWKPSLDAISVAFAPGKKIANASIEKWERKLIYERDPVFNWPMPKKAA